MMNFSSPGLSATLSERGTIKHNSVLEFVTSINYPPLAEVASKKPEVEKYAHYILIVNSFANSSLETPVRRAAIQKMHLDCFFAALIAMTNYKISRSMVRLRKSTCDTLTIKNEPI